jgi:hypothetical protein
MSFPLIKQISRWGNALERYYELSGYQSWPKGVFPEGRMCPPEADFRPKAEFAHVSDQAIERSEISFSQNS